VKTHIPVRVPFGTTTILTYCGRVMPVVLCIDRTRDCMEDATCRACRRSDDRRVIEAHNRDRAAAKAAGKPFPEDQ
jgi:hypothetical protein